jgi:hypothetical protein
MGKSASLPPNHNNYAASPTQRRIKEKKMSETQKRITVTVMLPISLVVDADLKCGAVEVVGVVGASGLPSVAEVMEALDGQNQLQQLDEDFAAAHGVSVDDLESIGSAT